MGKTVLEEANIERPSGPSETRFLRQTQKPSFTYSFEKIGEATLPSWLWRGLTVSSGKLHTSDFELQQLSCHG